MTNIKINKGFISHNGQLYKAGEIVPIADAKYAKRLVAQSGNDFEFYHGEVLPDGGAEGNPGTADGSDISDLDNGGGLPAVDADATVKTAKSARR